ncbi:MAG: hypothetical protein M0035_12485 [Actinomycetota bacterium]|nr:hypothetical protein [Actinomycetota bacterium]
MGDGRWVMGPSCFWRSSLGLVAGAAVAAVAGAAVAGAAVAAVAVAAVAVAGAVASLLSRVVVW